MGGPTPWTRVHYEIPIESFDCLSLPELLLGGTFIGFGEGDTHFPARTAAEIKAALLDLLEARAVDVFDRNEPLSAQKAREVIGLDPSWKYDSSPDRIEVVNNERTTELLHEMPPELNPHLPGRSRD